MRSHHGRRQFVALTILFAAAPGLAQTPRLRRIGYHSGASSQSNAGWLEAFRQGMAELGWIDGRGYVIDARYADGAPAAISRIAHELVATRPDLLLAPGDASARALAEATQTIPIVFAAAADPIGSGFAKTLRRPGGNLTGLTSRSPDLAEKRVQLLQEALPTFAHLVVLYEPAEPSGLAQLDEYRRVLERLKLRLTAIELRRPADVEDAFLRAKALHADAYAIATGFLAAAEQKALAAGALRAKMPAIGPAAYFAEVGVLMSYGVAGADHFRQAAGYVDKIFKGANPAELAIEQPKKYECVVNLRTARAIGVSFPRSVMLRADRVID